MVKFQFLGLNNNNTEEYAKHWSRLLYLFLQIHTQTMNVSKQSVLAAVASLLWLAVEWMNQSE